MNDSAPQKNIAEAVRQKRMCLEQLEKVTETRASIQKYGAAGAARHAKSMRVGRYLVWFIVALGVLHFGPQYYEFVVEPLIDGNFSPAAIREFAWKIAFFAGMFWLLFFYDKTPVKHLSSMRRAGVHVLLCSGGLAFLASCLLFATEYDVAAALALCGAGLILWFARKCANVSV